MFLFVHFTKVMINGGHLNLGNIPIMLQLTASFKPKDCVKTPIKVIFKPMSTIETQVVIVGAGISGLKAASDLHKGGCNSCVVLEGRDRIGGRLHTVEGYQGRKYDMGASWHHDTLVNGLFEEELGLPLEQRAGFVFDDDEMIMFDKDHKRLDMDPNMVLEILQGELLKFIELQFFESLEVKDRSYYEMIVKYLYQRRDLLTDDQIKYLPQVCRYLELWHGCDWKTLSSKFLEIAHQGRNAMVLHYSTIVKRVASTIPEEWIQLNSEVTEIKRCQNKVHVKTNKNKIYICDYVVVTVPQSVIELSLHPEYRRGRIEFIPPLSPEIRNAFTKTHYSALGKVVFEFENCCWSKERARILSLGKSSTDFTNDVRNAQSYESLLATLQNKTEYHLENGQLWEFPLYFVNLAKTTGVPSFVMLMQEPLTSYVESLQDKNKAYQFFQPILEGLLKTLGNSNPICVDFDNKNATSDQDIPVLKNLITTNWTREEFSLGAYSACFPGDDPMDLIIALTHNENSRIRYAGEHTIMDGAGCVYGAWESGKREAALILKNLQGL